MPQSMTARGRSDDDRISALPNEVLHHILGYLQAPEAVRTSVLAQRWRHIWKSTPVLRLTHPRAPIHTMVEFMNNYMLGRGNTSRLEILDLDCVSDTHLDVNFVNLWILYALASQISCIDLSVALPVERDHFQLDPIVTKHLRALMLNGPTLNDKFLDFSGCPKLVYLKLLNCRITASRISSPFLKCLEITKCNFNEDTRTRISVPSLVTIELVLNLGRTPLLEAMPLLESADVYLNCEGMDVCTNDDAGYCDDAACVNCYGTDDGSMGCVLLNGLAAATTLNLKAFPEEFILKRDLRFCPIFSNLKILSVSTWCVEADNRALICILQHSPVLENLTIDLFDLLKEPQELVSSKAIYSSAGKTFVLENLECVELNCRDFDKSIRNIIKLLITCGVPLEKIFIQCHDDENSECFSLLCIGFKPARVSEDVPCES